MVDLLTTIVNQIVCWIETGAVLFLNYLIATIAAVIGYIVTLLPNMPSAPTLPGWVATAADYVGYYFPVSYFLTLVTTCITLVLAWFVLAIPLRWFKAIKGNQ